MSADEFRLRGRQIIDFIADYLQTVESHPIRPSVRPAEIFNRLPAQPPNTGQPWDSILADALSADGPVLAGLTHWQHPSFFGYFPANTSYPGVLGDLLSSGLGVIGMLWATSPSCTEIEMRVLDWMASALGLPPSFMFAPNSTPDVEASPGVEASSTAATTIPTTPTPRAVAGPESGQSNGGNGNGGGAIHGTASEATLAALVAGRFRVLNLRTPNPANTANPDNLADLTDRTRITAYTSEQSHSSVMKAAMIAGLASNAHDHRRVRLIPVDRSGSMRADLLQAALQHDLANGLLPAFICATIGTTATAAVDSVPDISAAIDAAYSAHAAHASHPSPARPWLHVDAAYAGCAMICPEFAALALGLERADSFCFNPHKWLLTNFDCDCFYTSDRRSLTQSMAIQPSYLHNTASSTGGVVDYRDWHVPLGRRFRSLKLWFVMRHYGVEGLRAHIRHHVALAQQLESWISASEHFQLAARRDFALVCMRLKPLPSHTREQTDNRTRRVLEQVNATGRALLIHTLLPPPMLDPLDGAYIIRVSIGSPSVELRHIQDLWNLLQAAAANEVSSRP